MQKCETPISQPTKVKRAGDMTQVVEHQPSKCEAPSSNPSIRERERERERQERYNLLFKDLAQQTMEFPLSS
jgi:hypothetical protein